VLCFDSSDLFRIRALDAVDCEISNALKKIRSISHLDKRIVQVFDRVLNENVIAYMRHIFRMNGPFWCEHDYDDILTNSSRRLVLASAFKRLYGSFLCVQGRVFFVLV
jgi:hypothetical protein